VANLGGDAEAVIAAITQMLGAPDEDDGWGGGSYAGCPPSETRFLRWAGLVLFFSTGRTYYWDEGHPHFFSYTFNPYPNGDELALTTAAGIGPGSMVDDLRRVYPTVEFFTRAGHDTGWGVPNDGRELFFQWPWFGGGATGSDPSDTVSWVQAGYPCGE